MEPWAGGDRPEDRLRFEGFPHCVGCGEEHPHGLHLRFFRDAESIVGWPRLAQDWQGGPGIVHGGIVSLLLDEYSCAASWFLRGQIAVTGSLNVRFEAPCPVDRELFARAWVTAEDHRAYREIAAAVWCDGALVARSTGRFFPAPEG